MPTQSQPPALPEPAGDFLFSADVIAEITDQEQRHGIYTGERCPDDLKRAIVKLVGDGWSQREIARTLKTAPETVRNVATVCKADIRDYQDQLPRRLQRCIISGLDRLERNMDSVPLQSMGITLKALHDIETQASGRAIGRVEVVHRVDLFSDWQEFVTSLEQDQPEKLSAQKKGAGTHPAAGKLPVLDGELVKTAPAPADQADSDAKSLVSNGPSLATPTPLTTYHTTEPAAAPAETDSLAPTTGGGSRANAGATHGAKGNGSQKFLGNED